MRPSRGSWQHRRRSVARSRGLHPQTPRREILTSKAALEGERKQVTVLFADLKGSMELLADRDPEEARKILDPVLELMMEAVHRYEGTVNQVMGDRVGINSGEVVVRSIGSDLRMDYTAVGQTTHLAARMEQMARPDSILVAPDTLRLVEGFHPLAGDWASNGTRPGDPCCGPRAHRRELGAIEAPRGGDAGARALCRPRARASGAGARPWRRPAGARSGGGGGGRAWRGQVPTLL